MQYSFWQWFFFGLAIAALVGCGNIELVIKNQDSGEPVADPPAAPEMDPQRRAALEEADRLVASIAKGASESAVAGPPVRWVDARHPDARADDRPAATRAVVPEQIRRQAPPSAPKDPTPHLHLASNPPAPVAAEPAPVTVDYQRIAKVLRRQIESGSDNEVRKALNLSVLAVITGQRTLDESMLSPLDPRQRRLIERYHQMHLAIADQIADGQTRVDLASLSQTFDDRPISITRVELCSRVDKFGVFDAFESNTFVAGRPRPLVIYIELDHFKSVAIENDRREVRLSQQITLYSESDGLLVWQLPQEVVVDRSRNKRRDFFTVRQVVLPANIGTGKFLLKVKVADLHGDNEDEMSVPIHFVAGNALVDRKRFK